MSDYTAANIKVRVGQQNATKVVSSLSGTRTISLASLSDVDIGSGLQNGQVLVFNATTQKFETTLNPTIVTQNLDIKWGSFSNGKYYKSKRSTGTSAPGTLNFGELGLTIGVGTHGNKGGRVFAGDNSSNPQEIGEDIILTY